MAKGKIQEHLQEFFWKGFMEL